MSKYLRVLLCLLVVVLFSACRFKSPTLAEQAELGNRGVFSGGKPAWAGSTAGANRAAIRNSGAIPETFSTPLSVTSDQSVAEQTIARNSKVVAKVSDPVNTSAEVEKSLAAAQANPTITSVDKNSPLDRIAAACPGVDQSAQDTLLSTSLASRIASYEGLTKRCPSSKDLLTWLARDYLKAGRPEAAESAVRRALVLDPDFSEAQGVLRKALTVLGK